MNLPELIYLDFHQIPLLHIFLTHVWVCRPITSISIKSRSISSIRKDMCIDHLEPICDARCQDAQVLTFARHPAQIAPSPVALRCGWLAHKFKLHVVLPGCVPMFFLAKSHGTRPGHQTFPRDLTTQVWFQRLGPYSRKCSISFSADRMTPEWVRKIQTDLGIELLLLHVGWSQIRWLGV